MSSLNTQSVASEFLFRPQLQYKAAPLTGSASRPPPPGLRLITDTQKLGNFFYKSDDQNFTHSPVPGGDQLRLTRPPGIDGAYGGYFAAPVANKLGDLVAIASFDIPTAVAGPDDVLGTYAVGLQYVPVVIAHVPVVTANYDRTILRSYGPTAQFKIDPDSKTFMGVKLNLPNSKPLDPKMMPLIALPPATLTVSLVLYINATTKICEGRFYFDDVKEEPSQFNFGGSVEVIQAVLGTASGNYTVSSTLRRFEIWTSVPYPIPRH